MSHSSITPRAIGRPRLPSLLVFVSLAGGLLAQAPSSTPGSATGPAQPAEEAIQLSPFVVNADSDVGYVAASSLAGSRLNTSLRDTAASISVLTSEFLSDVGATNLTEALEWGNNVQLEIIDQASNDNTTFESFGDFRVRGIPATVTRNFFAWRLQTDGYNVERIEEQRGPNSILFGIGSAGGVLNQSTKRARFGRSLNRLTLVTDSEQSMRGAFDFNRELVKNRLALRVNGLRSRQNSYRQHVYNDDDRIHVATAFALRPGTVIRAEYETGKVQQVTARVTHAVDGLERWLDAGSPTIAAPIATNGTLGITRLGTGTRYTYVDSLNLLYNGANRNISTADTAGPIVDQSLADWSVNSGGPSSIREGGFNTTSVVLEQKLGRNTYVEIAYNHQDGNYTAYVPTIGGSDGVILRGDPHQFLANGQANPYVGEYFFEAAWGRFLKDSRSDNIRASLSTEFDLAKWGRYQLAAMAESESRVDRSWQEREVWVGAPFSSASPEGGTNAVYRRSYVTRGDWSTYAVSGPALTGLLQGVTDPVGGRTLSSTWVNGNQNIIDDPNRQQTLLASLQARYFSDRLVLTAGYRHDNLEITDRLTKRNAATNIWEVDYANSNMLEYTGKTRTLGAVGHVSDWLSVFVNSSNNFSLPVPNIRLLPDSQPAKSPEAEGLDYGFLLSLLDDRIKIRVNRFTLDLLNGHDFRFGGTFTNPTSINNQILNALVANGAITQATADARNINTNGASFERSVEGYESTITANLSKNWRLSLNYSYTDGREENIGPEVLAWAEVNIPYFRTFDQNIVTGQGNTIAQTLVLFEDAIDDELANEGAGIKGNRKHKFNVFTRYSFSSGPLKGLYVGGGYRHQSKNLIKRSQTDIEPYGNSYWLADAMMGYRFNKLGWLKGLSLQLNVANVFDYDRPLITRRDPDGSLDRWAVVAPRSWRLTANLDF